MKIHSIKGNLVFIVFSIVLIFPSLQSELVADATKGLASYRYNADVPGTEYDPNTQFNFNKDYTGQKHGKFSRDKKSVSAIAKLYSSLWENRKGENKSTFVAQSSDHYHTQLADARTSSSDGLTIPDFYRQLSSSYASSSSYKQYPNNSPRRSYAMRLRWGR